jgi:hypothetical protein
MNNGEPRPSGSTIADELNRLGRQLSEAARLAWESEDRKRLQSEITEGLRRFSDQVEGAMEQAQKSDTTRQFTEQAQKVMNNVRDTRIVDEVRDGLLAGLVSLNRELSRLNDRLGERTVPPAAVSPEPVVGPPPVTPPAAPGDVTPTTPPTGPSDPVI